MDAEGQVGAFGDREGLAVVEALDVGELLGVFLDEVGQAEEAAGAEGGVDTPPALEALFGGFDGVVDVDDGGVWHLGDDLARGGVADVESAALADAELALDEELTEVGEVLKVCLHYKILH